MTTPATVSLAQDLAASGWKIVLLDAEQRAYAECPRGHSRKDLAYTTLSRYRDTLPVETRKPARRAARRTGDWKPLPSAPPEGFVTVCDLARIYGITPKKARDRIDTIRRRMTVEAAHFRLPGEHGRRVSYKATPELLAELDRIHALNLGQT